jgi:predicted protein tyrosine phosphatase
LATQASSGAKLDIFFEASEDEKESLVVVVVTGMSRGTATAFCGAFKRDDDPTFQADELLHTNDMIKREDFIVNIILEYRITGKEQNDNEGKNG